MKRKFKKPNYEATLKEEFSIDEILPVDHLARYVVDVIEQLELKRIYARYGKRGGIAIAPEILLGILFYGYATGVFSSRKMERATYESIPMRYIAGGLHPDHDTIANFRKTFLDEIQELFVQILLLAQAAEMLIIGNISLDGSKIHADASKSKGVSYKRLNELEKQLHEEVNDLFEAGERVDQKELTLPATVVIEDEIARRETRLQNLIKAKAVLEARAKERYDAEMAVYEKKSVPEKKKSPQPENRQADVS